MSSEVCWQILSLKDAGVYLIDCDHRTPPAQEAGYPYIAIPQIKNGHIQLEGVRKISSDDYAEWTRKLKPQANDVIVVRRCSSGDSAVVPRGLECAIGQNLVILRSDGKRVLPEFLRWLLQGPDWWEQVNKFINVGAVFDSLKCREIPHFELTIPPLADQSQITALLGAIDDRITLLRETNVTLESIAQALFKSWFFNFDPVHAKQQGIAPEGLDEATAALFADSFEESELGLMPKGWRVGTVEDLCEVIANGGTPSRSKKEFWQDGSIAWYKTGEFSDGFLLSPSERITEVALKNSSVKCLPENAVLMAIYAAPTVGRLGILTESSTFNQACTGMVARADVGPWYLFWVLYFGRDWFNSRANGAAQQNISKAIVSSYKVFIPSLAILKAFHVVAESLHLRVRANSEKIRTLTSLRDILLPRLISGQLRLPESTKLLEEAEA